MKKILYLTIPIITFFLGVFATFTYLEEYEKDETLVKHVTEVEISESDTIKDSVDKVYDAVVTVNSYSNGLINSLGTGFVYKTDEQYGYILTNNHVISKGNSFKVVNNNGEEIDAKLLGSDEYVDAAVLKIDVKHVTKIANLGNSDELEVGDTVFTVGTPISMDYVGTVTKGIVSGKERTVTIDLSNGSEFMLDVIQTNAAINPGNSGGPLCNINGEIIGINTLKLVEDKIEGMGFAIPIEMVTAIVDRLEKGEKILRPLLGVSLMDATNFYYLAKNDIYLDDSIKNGVVVMEVEPDSVISKTDLKKGDVILKIDGVDIKNTTHFRYLLYKHQVGETIKLEYYQDGNKKEISIKLENSL